MIIKKIKTTLYLNTTELLPTLGGQIWKKIAEILKNIKQSYRPVLSKPEPQVSISDHCSKISHYRPHRGQ